MDAARAVAGEQRFVEDRDLAVGQRTSDRKEVIVARMGAMGVRRLAQGADQSIAIARAHGIAHVVAYLGINDQR